MKLKEKIENWNEFVFYISIVLILIFTGIMLNLPIYLHEYSHSISCERYGGNPILKKVDRGYETTCNFPKETYTKQNQYNFIMAGIYGELILAFILLLLPFTAPVGGYYFVQIAWNLWQGSYNFDLTHAVELFPNSFAGIMLQPGFRIFFMIISILIFLLSLEYLWVFVKKYLDIPGI